MTDRNRDVLNDLLQRPGNNICADCKTDENVDWTSCNIGIFLCQECAGIHRSLGVDISRVKSIKLDFWEDDLVKKMAECGNEVVNKKYEQHLPSYYKRPTKDDVEVLRTQFIRAKYQRKEFVYQDKQTPYSDNKKEGILMKKVKKDRTEKYNPRRFIINSKDNCIQYYNSDKAKEPKNTLLLDDVNVVFVPDKIKKPNAFQINYLKNGVTRNLYLYCDDSKDAVDWFTAIRSAKLERRRLAFPDRDEQELCKDLTQNFLLEGYFWKRGPNNEPYKKRWFILDRRKLMYMEDKLSPTPKGEIYIGHKDSNYSVSNNTSGNALEFVLTIPGRQYQIKGDTIDDKERFVKALETVIDSVPTPQDIRIFSQMSNYTR